MPAERTSKKLIMELRKEAASVVRRVVAEAFPRFDEVRPSSVRPATAKQITEAVIVGAAHRTAYPHPDLDDGFIVGFDFGTSSMKLAVRQPYRANEPLAALTAPMELRSDGHAHLWQTVVWYDPSTERFQLHPTSGAIALDGFKSALISGHGSTSAVPGVTQHEATVAFLALMICYVLGRYKLHQPLGSQGAAQFMTFNVGVPIASLDDKSAVWRFHRALSAAWLAAPSAPDLTLALVRQSISQPVPQHLCGFSLVPELTACIAGYAQQKGTARPGAHVLVDVGASTLDIVAFNLLDHATRVSVFSASVELFGASALRWAIEAGVDEETFKRACDHQFMTQWYELVQTMCPDGFNPSIRREPVQLLVTGGGCSTTVHRPFLLEMLKPGLLGKAKALRPAPPAGMAQKSSDSSRLLLAFGLTRDVPELAQYRLPSIIEPVTMPTKVEPSPITKEMV